MAFLTALHALIPLLAAGKLHTIWETGKHLGHVEIRYTAPDPKEFFDVYVTGAKGHPDEVEGKWKDKQKGMKIAGGTPAKQLLAGRPVLMKGLAKQMPAFSRWASDELLLETGYGAVVLDQVETEKAETRTKYPHDNWNLKKFIANYNKSVVYSTATPPKKMQNDLFLLPSFNCGGFTGKIRSSVMWWSSGGTQSVIHSDPGHNQYCQFAGSKRWAVWHPSQHRQSKDLGWVHAEEEAKKDKAWKDAYGAWYGKVDYNAMDVEKYPAWKDMEYYTIDMEAGDCSLLPHHWMHHVEAPKNMRSLAVHVWISAPKKFDEASCDKLTKTGANVSDMLFRFADCTMGFEDPDKRVAKTKCKLRRSAVEKPASGGEL